MATLGQNRSARACRERKAAYVTDVACLSVMQLPSVVFIGSVPTDTTTRFAESPAARIATSVLRVEWVAVLAMRLTGFRSWSIPFGSQQVLAAGDRL